jgi:hypothetical protein
MAGNSPSMLKGQLLLLLLAIADQDILVMIAPLRGW